MHNSRCVGHQRKSIRHLLSRVTVVHFVVLLDLGHRQRGNSATAAAEDSVLQRTHFWCSSSFCSICQASRGCDCSGMPQPFNTFHL